MGLFSKLFGGDVDKDELIRELTKLRVKNDPMPSMMGFDESMVDQLSELQLAGLPEGTIVTIVETWSQLIKKGIPEEEILMRIEDHRSSFGDYGEMPSPLTLSSYIKYRLDLEHQDGAPISEDFIDNAIKVSKKAFK